MNDSRVIPGRLRGRRAGGGAAEVLALRPADDPLTWLALVRPSRRLAVGAAIEVAGGERIIVGRRNPDGTRLVTFPA